MMKYVVFSSSADIEHRFEEIDVDPNARKIMLEKFQFVIIEIPQMRNVEANIIKQEMLVLGGEAAVSRHSISCSVPVTRVLISGTKKMFRTLIERLRPQVGDLKNIADEFQKLLFSS